ncbi:hypothetical protein PRK78_000638 [Emydomyces testavorans]|uniref:Uncharacterized protein n=1 Tax=Emydomyces testavorans TaxID=2070801 RepID=A0AAF0DB37_9EURO|nr:hypothetical protein PRK78_000638 [Emydomyces testavorans]
MASSTTTKLPSDPLTPQTAHSTCSIFLPPPYESFLPASASASTSTSAATTPLTAHSTCSIFEPETPSSIKWMHAKCTLGVGSVVPRVIMPNNPTTTTTAITAISSSSNNNVNDKPTKTKPQKCGGWEIYQASLPLRNMVVSKPSPAPTTTTTLASNSRKAIAERMKALLARRVHAFAPSFSTSSSAVLKDCVVSFTPVHPFMELLGMI